MTDLDLVGLDLAKNVFQLPGCSSTGEVVFRKQLRRRKLLREPLLGALGHSVRLIALKYVKPFVKRSKSDAIDAEAICEAALRPTMRFVQVQSEDNQGAGPVGAVP